MQHFGTAIFTDRDGRSMVYQLCNPMPTDPSTIVAEFKPRSFKEITVEDHDGSGNHYRYTPDWSPPSFPNGE